MSTKKDWQMVSPSLYKKISDSICQQLAQKIDLFNHHFPAFCWMRLKCEEFWTNLQPERCLTNAFIKDCCKLYKNPETVIGESDGKLECTNALSPKRGRISVFWNWNVFCNLGIKTFLEGGCLYGNIKYSFEKAFANGHPSLDTKVQMGSALIVPRILKTTLHKAQTRLKHGINTNTTSTVSISSRKNY